ncbi:hypothetical protein [Nostoc sp.]|uniref:hypothetical protein n=1 Tax=Nostoc sp. TaxID=1180 RepID=UPI002FF2328A
MVRAYRGTPLSLIVAKIFVSDRIAIQNLNSVSLLGNRVVKLAAASVVDTKMGLARCLSHKKKENFYQKQFCEVKLLTT